MLKAPENVEYKITVVQLKPWRVEVTLTEYRLAKRKMVATGRAWSEPFDPVKGDEDELEGRFDRQITHLDNSDIPQTPTEVLRDHLEDCFCLECVQIPPRFFQLIKKWRLRKAGKLNA